MITDMPVTAVLHALVEQGVLRPLGAAFSEFVGTLAPRPQPALLIGAALVSELDGRGHTCLRFETLAADPCATLSWTPAAWAQLCAAAGTLPASAYAWSEALGACSQVLVAGAPDLGQPLVVDSACLYLRRHWNDERQVAALTRARVDDPRQADPAEVRRWLDRLFDPAPDGNGPDWQKIACAVALRSRFTVITGGPGTGKTYTVARLMALLLALSDDPSGVRIALAAPTGKAAMRMKQAIGVALAELDTRIGAGLSLPELFATMGPALTLHALLGISAQGGRARHHAGNPLGVDVLIVDEASMVHSEMMADLLAALPASAMLVLLGDKDQLPSVEAGAVLGDLCAGAAEGHYQQTTADYVHAACGETLPESMVTTGTAVQQQIVMLRRSRRFDGPIAVLAAAINAGHATDAATALESSGDELAWMANGRGDDVVALAVRGRSGAPGGYGPYLQLLRARNKVWDAQQHATWAREVVDAFDSFRILCAVREGDWGVAGINARLEKHFDSQSLLRCRGDWYPGRPVLVTRNDHGLGVFNGDVGICLADPLRAGALRVYFAEGRTVRSVLASRLGHVETAFAMTVHKSQGSEFAHVALVLPGVATQVATRELVYTGITRASSRFTLVSRSPALLDDALARQTSRATGLRKRIVGGQETTPACA